MAVKLASFLLSQNHNESILIFQSIKSKTLTFVIDKYFNNADFCLNARFCDNNSNNNNNNSNSNFIVIALNFQKFL